jgi:hypothetical protein
MTFNQVIAQSYRTPLSIEEQQDKIRVRMAAALLLANNTSLYAPNSAEVMADFLNAKALYSEWIVD